MAELENKKTGLLEASPGNKSMMRVGFLLARINSTAISLFVIVKGDTSGNGLYLCCLFLIAAFGGKGVQSFAEHLKK